MSSQNNVLSPKAKENLQRNAELRQKDSKFIKIQGQNILKFDPEKIEPIEANFNGKKTQRYRYTVTDPNNPGKEKYFEVGKQTSEVIDSYLIEGHNLLKVQRFGSGVDTRYHVTPA